MEWKTIDFETENGKRPLEEFTRKQQPSAKAKIVRSTRLLRQYGNLLGMPHSKRLDKNLFELRIRGKEELRILYCFKNYNILLLHIFKKQTQKTPRKEIETAQNRMKLIFDKV